MTYRPVGSRFLDESLDDAPKRLFWAILETLADTDVFSNSTSPSIFIVYAHDNPKEETANSWCVRHLIDWLGAIRSRTLSDKSPLPLWSTREGGSAAVRNILDNQFCLLPTRNSSDETGIVTSVDKVVVCGSGLLKRYYEDPFTPSYIKALEVSYIEGQAQCANPQELQCGLRNVVEKHCHRPGFHHVLTELAFIKLRGSFSQGSKHCTIPVALDEDLMAYLPFRNPSDLVLKLHSPSEADLHRLFFRLLRQVYMEAQSLITRFESCYKIAIGRIDNEAKDMTSKILETIIYSEIHQTIEDLRRLDGATLRNLIQQCQLERILSRIRERSQVPVTDERRRRFLSKLPTVLYRDRKDRNPERTEGTCEWFMSHQLFRNWQLSKKSSLLWVSADPGCGKSVLAKHLVDSVLPSTSTRTTSYFFFKDDFEDQRNVENAMRCLLHQLFTQRPVLLTHAILEKFEEDNQLFKSFTNLWDTLITVASQKDAGEVICILDALDECKEEGRSRLAMALYHFYRNESSSSLKFLLTSRPYSDIRRGFQALEDQRPTIHLSGENQAEVDKISSEIGIVIGAKVKETGSRLKLERQEEQLLEDELTRQPHRSYLWVYLVFDAIHNAIETTSSYLIASIRKLPKTVEEAYEKILSRSSDIIKARRLLHIVMAAKRPLSLQEMATALAIRKEHVFYHQLELEPEDRFRHTVRELCGLFIIIIDCKIYLLHQTAREFLAHNSLSIAPQITTWQNSFSSVESQDLLSEICMQHLCFSDIEALDLRKLTSLVEYAATSWMFHFRGASDAGKERLLRQAERLCDGNSPRCKEWIDIYLTDPDSLKTQRDFPNHFTPLMVASYLGLQQLVAMLLRNKQLNIQYETHGLTALSWACIGGHEDIVKMLLSRMTKKTGLRRILARKCPGLDLRDKYGLTPLISAVMRCDEEIVESLLREGADVETKAPDGSTALSHAVSMQQGGMVRQLLKRGANVNVKNKHGQTPLIEAATCGHEDIVWQLLHSGARLEVRNLYGWTSLWHAIYNGCRVIRRLPQKGAEMELPGKQDRTPLVWPTFFNYKDGRISLFEAAYRGHEEVVRRLLEKGMSIEVESEREWTPLCFAVHGNQEGIVQLLLEKGAKTEIQSKDGQTPLSLAVSLGYEVIVQQLLKNGAEIEVRTGEDGETPLLIAVGKGYNRIVRLLLDKGAKLEVRDKHGRTPLSIATEKGHSEIVQQLLEEGADLEDQDRHGRTPLMGTVER
ncbi:hypothetical protein GGR53DRAFT_400231 [Hypoxylon sp. FL1150]|nr:hypothetical protein GGR53DRAFT_400231 [Hypoxylon sp. FL1150]